MARFLKQSTAFIFRIGPFLDDSDGKTAEILLNIAQVDIQISKNGGAFAQTSAGAPVTTHDKDGWYQCPLTTTDTNTLGSLTIQITMVGALPVWVCFTVLHAQIYNSLIAASDKLTVDVREISGDSGAADNAESYFDGTGYINANNLHTLTAATETQIDDIKIQTDKMNFTGTDIKATLDGEEVNLVNNAITAAKINAAAANKIADHTIRRTAANVRASADGDAVNFRSALGAISKLVNKVATVAALLTVYEEDDVTEFKQQVLVRDSNADPIIEIDTS